MNAHNVRAILRIRILFLSPHSFSHFSRTVGKQYLLSFIMATTLGSLSAVAVDISNTHTVFLQIDATLEIVTTQPEVLNKINTALE